MYISKTEFKKLKVFVDITHEHDISKQLNQFLHQWKQQFNASSSSNPLTLHPTYRDDDDQSICNNYFWKKAYIFIEKRRGLR